MSSRAPFTFQSGLKTAVSRTVIPDGGLDIAENITYRPRDGAATPCNGRALVGGGGHDARWMSPLYWDTKLSSTEPRKSELLYVASNTYRTIPPAAQVDDERMTPGLAASLTTVSPILEEPDVVAYGRDHYLFGGGYTQWLRRSAGIEEIVPSQMSPNNIALKLDQTSDVLSPWPATGIYFIFFTWYDSYRNVESGIYPKVVRGSYQAPDSSILGWLADGTTADGSILVSSSVPTHIDLYVNKNNFDAQRLQHPTADKLRFYCTLLDPQGYIAKWYTATSVYSTAPTVIERKEILISAIQASTPVNVPGYGVEPHYRIESIRSGEISDGSSNAFPVSRVTIENSTVASVRAFTRPRSRTACAFNGSLVQDDIDAPQRFWFTYPNDPHSIPSNFFGDIQGDGTDEIMAIRTVRSRCGIFSKAGVHRLNYLPTAADTNFRNGLITEQISTNGLPSRRAVTRFSIGGKLDSLAWASAQGIYRTESLYDAYEMTPDIDWGALVGDVGNLSTSILVDDPNWQRLWFFFSSNGTIPDKAILLHYAGATENEFPVTGPIPRPGGVKSAFLVTCEDGVSRLVCLDAAGSFYYEGIGYADPSISDAPLPWRLRTGRKYLAERGISAQAHQALLSIDKFGGGEAEVLMQIERGLTGEPTPPKEVVFVQRDVDDALLIRDANTPLEHTSITLYGNAGPFRINAALLDWDPLARSPRRSS